MIFIFVLMLRRRRQKQKKMDFGLIVVAIVVLIGFRFYSEYEWSIGSIYMEKRPIKMGNESVVLQWKTQSKYLNAVIKTIFYLQPWHALHLLKKEPCCVCIIERVGADRIRKKKFLRFPHAKENSAIWCLSHGLDLIGRTECGPRKKMAFENALEIDAIINKLNVSREFRAIDFFTCAE